MSRLPGREGTTTRRGEKSNFSLTCTLLSQYIKENGDLGDLISFGIASLSAHDAKRKPETPRTMNLFPGVESPAHLATDRSGLPESQHAKEPYSAGQSAAQMTIFYAGRVLVLDNFPAEKAQELMGMATQGKPAAAAQNAAALPNPAAGEPVSKSKPVAAAGAALQDLKEKHAHLPNASDLPIARRISLNRFLEKRKGRISSMAPYEVNGSPDFDSPSSAGFPAKAEAARAWLGLAGNSS